jgi:hypothetical protein
MSILESANESSSEQEMQMQISLWSRGLMNWSLRANSVKIFKED